MTQKQNENGRKQNEKQKNEKNIDTHQVRVFDVFAIQSGGQRRLGSSRHRMKASKKEETLRQETKQNEKIKPNKNKK